MLEKRRPQALVYVEARVGPLHPILPALCHLHGQRNGFRHHNLHDFIHPLGKPLPKPLVDHLRVKQTHVVIGPEIKHILM